MKLKITCTNGKKGEDNAGFTMNLQGSKAQVLEKLEMARAAINALPEGVQKD